MKSFFFALGAIVASISVAFSQTYSMVTTGSTNITTCSGVLYDPGGTGDYPNNANSTITICPSTPGSRVQLDFVTFQTRQSADYLVVYDGDNTSAPTMGTYSTNMGPGIVAATPSNSSGCITLRFVSNGSQRDPGFVANISCIIPCQSILSQIYTTTPVAVSDIIKICEGESISVTGGATFSNSSAGATYTWNWGDGTTTVGANASHSYANSGIYNISLITTDPSGCKNTNTVYKTVQVASRPTISTSVSPTEICLDQSVNLSATTTQTPEIIECAEPISDTTFLPDGTGVSYQTSINVDCYNSSQLITAATDISNVCLNIEHSYLGDLNLVLTCPTGQSITLHQYPNGLGTFLGVPIDDDAVLTPGVGYTYCFDNSANTLLVNGTVTSGSLNAGTYKPVTPISNFIGCPFNGDWTLVITDNLAQDNGYIFFWDINFSIPPPPSSSFTPTTLTESWTAVPGLTSTSSTTAIATPLSAGTACYQFKTTNNFGCSDSAIQCITVNPLPNITLTSSQDICVGENTSLSTTAVAGYTYSWIGPNGFTSTSNTINITSANTNQSGRYTLTVTDINGCSDTASTLLNIYTIPTTPSVGTDIVICQGQNINLSTSSVAGATYAWSGPNGFTSSLQNPTIVNANPLNSGVYSLIVTVNECSSSTSSLNVTVNESPIVDAGADQSFCNGTEITLNGSGAVNYTWDNGITNNVPFNVFASNTYTVIGTDNNGCSDTDQVSINVWTNPIVDAGTDQSFCNGTEITLNGSGAVNYTWDNGVVDNTPFNVFTTTTYTVIGFDNNNCSDTDQVSINVWNNPIVDAGADQSFCNGTEITLNGSGAVNYTWDNGVVDNTPFNVFTTTTFTVIGFDNNNCSDTDQVSINVWTNPIVDAGADQSYCNGSQITLAAGGALNYTWDNGITNNVPFNVFASNTYTVIGTDNNGCSDTDQVSINVWTNPIVDAGTDQSFCNGSQITLAASGALNYTWDNGITNNVPFNVFASNTYTVIGFDNNNCSDTDQVSINVWTNPIVDAGTDQSYCNGSQITLAAGGAVNYTWDNGVVDNTPFNVFTTTTYTVIGFDNNNCSDTDQVSINVWTNPIVDAGADQSFCNGSQINLAASGAVNYTWDNGIVDNTPFNIFNTTTFTVIGFDNNNCSDTDQVSINVWTNPIVDAGTDQSFCNGTEITLNGSGAVNYTWDNGVVDNTPFNVFTTTTYTVIGFDNNNCSDTDQVSINVWNNPIVDAGADQSFCNGTEITLNGSGALNYTWDNGITDNTPFNVFTTTTYTVIGFDNNNCSDTDQVSINVWNNPIVDAGADQSFCNGSQITLAASGALNYTWDNGVVDNTPFNIFNTTTFTVIGFDNNNCSDTDQVSINVWNNPIVDAGTDQSFCNGTEITLNGSGALNYTWDNGVVDNTPFNIFNTTTFTVIGFDNNNCSDTDQVSINVWNNPIVDAGADQSFCNGTEITLNGSGAVNYTWDNGVVDNTPFNVFTTTTYTVIGFDNNNCSDTDQVSINVWNNPIVDAGADQSFCNGSQITLAASGAVNYTWDNGITNNVPFNVFASNTYTVIGTDNNGCSDTDQVSINVWTNPIVDAGTDQSFCNGTEITLNGSGAVNYTWDNGVVDNTPFNVFTTTTYTVIGFDNNNCSDTDQVSINVWNNPIVDAGADQSFCNGTEITLNGSGAVNYTWDNGITNNVPFNVFASNTFTVIGTDNNGCSDTDQVSINVWTNPIVDAGADQSFCNGTEITLNGSGAVNYTWDNGITNNVPFNVFASNTYTVIGTDNNGCSDTDQVSINVWTNPIVDAGADQSFCNGTEITLNGSGAVNYTWDNGVVDNTPFNIFNTTNFTVIGFDNNNCSDTDQVSINVWNNPIVDAGADQSFCNGSQITLAASGAINYTWDNGIVDNTPFNVFTTTTYTVIGFDNNNCSDTDQVSINVWTNPIVDAGADQSFCNGSQIILAAGGAINYTWDNGVVDNTPFNIFNTTTFTVIGFDNNNCSDTDQVSINVWNNPIVDAGADQSFCNGTEITLAASGAVNYTWDNGVVDNTPFNVFTTTTYTVIGFDNNNCSDTDQVSINVWNNPIVDAGTDQSFCNGTEITLNGSGAVNYTWDNGISDNTPFNIFNTTTFTVIGFDNNNCSDTDQVSINVWNNPIVDAGADQSFCNGTEITLAASGAVNYTWDNGVVDNTPFNIFITTTFTVIGFDNNNCSDTDQVSINVWTNPIVDAGADQSFCNGSQITLAASGAVNYTWDNGITNNVPFNVFASNTFTVIGTDNNGCSDTDQVSINVWTNPIVDAGADQSFCNGTEITLNGSGAVNYTWDNGVVDNTPFNILNTTTFTVIGFDNNNCSDTDQVSINVWTNPIVDAGTDQSFCNGTEITLNGSGAVNYTWDNGVVDNTPFNVFTSTTYTVIGFDNNNCSDTDQVSINVWTNPIVDAGTDQSYCNGTEITLNGSGAVNYTWDNGVVDNTPFNIFNTTTFTVIGFDNNNCSDTDQVSINVWNNPIVDAGADQSFCNGTEITLNGSGAVNYTWDNGVVDNTPFNVFTTTTYTVIGFDNNNCSDTDQVSINVWTNPIVDAGADQSFCNGSQITLAASGALNYTWDNGVADNTPFNVFTTTTYTVIGFDNNNCSDTDQVSINVWTNPIVDAGADQSFCNGSQITLAASGAVNYTWDNGVVDNTPFNVFTTTTYTVIGFDNNNCSDTDQVSINVWNNPIVDAGADQSFCNGSQITLAASGAVNYTWDNGITDNTPFNVFTTTTYTVIGTDNNGCSDTDQVSINVWNNPIVDAGIDQAVCYGNDVTVTATGAQNYVWDNGVIQSNPFMPSNTNTYTVIGFDNNNCSDTAQIQVVVWTNPIVDAGASQTVCDGYTITLNATGATTYVWDQSVVDNTPFVINNSSTFTVIGFDANNCSDTDQVYIHVNPIPAIPNVQTAGVYCQGDIAILDASTIPGATYYWTTPMGTNIIQEDLSYPNVQLNVNGNFSLYIVVNECSSLTANYPITVNPTYQFNVDHSICEGSNYEYLGQTFINAGTYHIEFNTIHGCDSVVTLHLSTMTTPTADFHMPYSEDLGEGMILVQDNSVNAQTVYYYTNNGQASNAANFNLSFNTDGEIEVTQVALNGVCSDSLTKVITIRPEGNAYIPNSFTPGKDGVNDTWRPVISYLIDYNIIIFDRWGEIVYETNNIYDGWNGGWKNDIDNQVEQGTYIYKLTYRTMNGKFQNVLGHINLIR